MEQHILKIIIDCRSFTIFNATEINLQTKFLLVKKNVVLNPAERLKNSYNRRALIRHQCRKTTVLSCHRCLINTCIEKMNSI